jgi:predicted NAD/FAD-dependent oxidoreductase
MNAVAKHLAEGLDVRRSSRVDSLEAGQRHWTLRLEPSGEPVRPPLVARGVVMTAPVPQALELLDRGGVQLAADDRSALERITYDPCLAVMLSVGDGPVLPGPGAMAPAGGPLDWVADNRAKGISSLPALTVHVGAAASRDWWDRADAEVIDLVVAELGALTGTAPGVVDSSVQRWRYARPTATHPEPCLSAGGVPPLVFAGDAFGEAKVEGAVCSGWAAAAALRARIRHVEGPPA